MSRKPQPVIQRFERFFKKVEDGCWLWRGATTNGYGVFGLRDGVKVKAHRLAWELYCGPIPEGMNVLHHCDNRRCVNVWRCLFLGSAADNRADCVSKGRHQHGVRHWRSKLVTEQVLEIRKSTDREYGSGALLARRFGVTNQTIYDIRHGRHWKSLTLTPTSAGTVR